jgi:hypothetical protein
LTTA